MIEVVMKLQGFPDGSSTPFDGEFLEDFDFDYNCGAGMLKHTPDIEKAKVFLDVESIFEYMNTVPKYMPERPDGEPNKPLFATNWEILKKEDA